MTKLTANQKLYLLRIAHGQPYADLAPNRSGRMFTLHSLTKRGLVRHAVGESGREDNYRLTVRGYTAIGVPVPVEAPAPAEHQPVHAKEDEQVTCAACRTRMAPDPVEPAAPPEPEHGILATAPNKSWAPEVTADDTGKWYGNQLCFATREEAEANVLDLSWRWMSVRETRVVESTDEVNYQWDTERGLVSCVKKEG